MNIFELIDRAEQLAHQYPDAERIELINRLYSESFTTALGTAATAVDEALRKTTSV